MPQCKLGWKGFRDSTESLQLQIGIVLAAVGIGEVGEQTLKFQAGQLQKFVDRVDLGFDGAFIAEQTQAGHAGVQLQVAAQTQARTVHSGRQCVSHVGVVYSLRKLLLRQ